MPYPALNLTGKTPASTYTNLLQKEGSTILVDGEGNVFLDLANYATTTAVSASISESYGNNTASYAINTISSSYTVTSSYVDLTTITSSNVFISQSLFIGQSGSSVPTALLIKGEDIGSTNYAFVAGSRYTNYLSLRNDGVFTINTDLGMGAGLGMRSNSSAASILFATGGGSSGNIILSTSGSSVNGTQRHIILKTSGSVGINTDTPQSGSSLTVQGLLTASVVRADSFFGTASYAERSLVSTTASLIRTGSSGAWLTDPIFNVYTDKQLHLAGDAGVAMTSGDFVTISTTEPTSASVLLASTTNAGTTTIRAIGSNNEIRLWAAGGSNNKISLLSDSIDILSNVTTTITSMSATGSLLGSSSFAVSGSHSQLARTASYFDVTNLTSSNVYISQSLLLGTSSATTTSSLFVRGFDNTLAGYAIDAGSRTTQYFFVRNDGNVSFPNSFIRFGAGFGIYGNSANGIQLFGGGTSGTGNILIATSGSLIAGGSATGNQRHILLRTSGTGSVGINIEPNMVPISGSALTVNGLITASIVQSTEFVGTSSWSNFATTASHTVNTLSASYSLTSSYALNGGGGGATLITGSTYPITSSWAITASFVNLNSILFDNITSSNVYISQSLLLGTSSATTTSSLFVRGFDNTSAGYAIDAGSRNTQYFFVRNDGNVSFPNSFIRFGAGFGIYGNSAAGIQLFGGGTSGTGNILIATSGSLIAGGSATGTQRHILLRTSGTGSVGINIEPNMVPISGSALTVNGNITASSISANLINGTSSWSNFARTASLTISSSFITYLTQSSLNVTNSYTLFTTQSIFSESSSWASGSVSSSYSLTSSYALNGGGGNAATCSYFNEASASLITGSFYLRSNSGSLWKLTVFEDGDHIGTLQLEGPYQI